MIYHFYITLIYTHMYTFKIDYTLNKKITIKKWGGKQQQNIFFPSMSQELQLAE